MKRNLNQEELQYIDEFIFSRGIHYYDLIQELRDHIASIIEQDEENTFDDSMYIIMQEFSSDEFQKILRSKTKSLEKKWRNRFWTHLYSYFTFPKIVITIAMTIAIMFLSQWITPVLICGVIGILDSFSHRKRRLIDFKAFLITKTFRRQITIFYIIPIIYFLFDDFFTPAHLQDGHLTFGLILYGLTCSFILISQWACCQQFYNWLTDELESNYSDYLIRS